MPDSLADMPVLMPQVAAPSARRALPQRNILLLQGLMGPLFRRLGLALRHEGYGVYKVNFNGGDRLFWRLPNGIDYRGSLDDWPKALRRLIEQRSITDVVLFGDCRPIHIKAIEVCKNVRVPVHVFEEGYIRPGWVTLELGGVNGHSTLPRDPEWYLREAAALPTAPEHHPAPASFRRRAMEGLAYNTADLLTRWRYPHWENHRPWHPLVEGMGWARRLLQRGEAAARSDALIAKLRASREPYMLFPLQLDSDAQIRLHSPFAGISDALKLVIESFAAHAPAQLRLVVKEHPLNNGVRDWRLETMELARRHAVAERVDYLESGDLAPIAEKASGMVTINSTSGTLALACGVPVIALGQAVYDMEGITYQGELDTFWSDPGRPHGRIYSAFCRVLIDRCLVAGGFFSEQGLERVTQGVIERLERAGPLARSTSAEHSGWSPLPASRVAGSMGKAG